MWKIHPSLSSLPSEHCFFFILQFITNIMLKICHTVIETLNVGLLENLQRDVIHHIRLSGSSDEKFAYTLLLLIPAAVRKIKVYSCHI